MLPRHLLVILLCLPAAAMSAVDLTSLPATHPRLVLTPERVTGLRRMLDDDRHAAFLWRRVHNGATAMLDLPVLERRMEGYRLLHISRECLRRLLYCSLAHVLSGDVRFRDRAVAEIEAVCAFPDWNPDHFLDVAEMTAALALAHDWLYEGLSPMLRERIEHTIIDKGLRPSLEKGNWWIDRDNNWNQVCHCGMVLGALATVERDGALAQRIIDRAKANIHHGIEVYAPNGVYPEGAGYWSYGTDFTVLMLGVLETALGSDWGIPASPGFVASFDFRRHAMDPSGSAVLFADAGWDNTRPGFLQSYYIMGRLAGRADLLHFIESFHERHCADDPDGRGRLFPLALAWYRSAPPAEDAPPLDWFGTGGAIQVAFLRSGWDDDRSLWASLKGGRNAWNHSHLDTGVFEFAADGVRWAWDLGADKHLYSRKDTWGQEQDAARWSYLRTHNRGHNVVQVGGRTQRVAGSADIVRHGSNAGHAFAVLDTSSAYAGMASTARRGIALIERQHLLVQDRFTGLVAEPLHWRWYTRATIELAGDRAILRADDEELTLRILAPTGASFSEGSVQPAHDYENPNEGFRLLEIVIEPPHDEGLDIAVLATPGSSPAADDADLVALDDWAQRLAGP